jgi:hypothetical protein
MPALAAACGDEGGEENPPGMADSGGSDPVDAAAADAGAEPDGGLDTDTTGGFAGPKRSSATSEALALPPASPFRALQMNLCNSGYAGCFEEGRAIAEGRGVIVQTIPDVVTLNEICEDDVHSELFPAMRDAWPDDFVFWVFAPAASRNSGGPVTCTDGQRYGIGILGHVPAARWTGFEFEGGRLANQTDDNEMRAWACAYATGDYYTCVTHLENDNGDVAMLQCQEVMNPLVPQFWGAHGGNLPTIVGGDLNLRFSGSPDVQDCVPPAWFRKGDGDVQHIMATDDFTFDSSELIPMQSTDHDAWLVHLITPAAVQLR